MRDANTTTEVASAKPRRSVEFPEELKVFLKNHTAKFPALVDAAIDIGVDRGVLARALMTGSSSEKTFEKLIKLVQ